MSDTAYLALILDAPMQSWGFSSRFQRRTTGLHPTKSGLIGLLCAALGLAKGSPEEREMLPELAKLKMTSIAVPREVPEAATPLPVLRLEDYHTVLGTRRASGKLDTDAVETHRQYLVDARFGVILAGDQALLKRVAAALQDPVWGVWFGRKSCLPCSPICCGLFDAETPAQRKLIGNRPIEEFTIVTEAAEFTEGSDSISDQPISFGDGTSSGPDKRRFAVRRVKVVPGLSPKSATENPK
jgi:CRISPR system Cascade subunit CasD